LNTKLYYTIIGGGAPTVPYNNIVYPIVFLEQNPSFTYTHIHNIKKGFITVTNKKSVYTHLRGRGTDI